MLARRIIPCLDVMNGRVVKGVNFVNLRDAGDPVEQAAIYDREGADELVFLDITASHEGRATMLEMVRQVADTLFIPFCVGGGIRAIEDIRATLLAGADKIAINSAAVRTPDLINQGAWGFGSQCIVVAIDPKWTGSNWEVCINGGRVPTGLDAIAWAKEVEARGAGEILLTSMDRDGTKNGYNLELTAAVSSAVSIPVIQLAQFNQSFISLRFLCDFDHGIDALFGGEHDHLCVFTIHVSNSLLRQPAVLVGPDHAR